MSEGEATASDIQTQKLTRRRLLKLGAGVALSTVAGGGVTASILRSSENKQNPPNTPQTDQLVPPVEVTPTEASRSYDTDSDQTSSTDVASKPPDQIVQSPIETPSVQVAESSLTPDTSSVAPPSVKEIEERESPPEYRTPTPDSGEKVELKDVPHMSLIDGVETYGDEIALQQGQLDTLLAFINENPKIKMQAELYTTQYVTQEVYNNFKNGNYGETYQTFITRHVSTLNDILSNTKENGNVLDQTQLNLRRLIIIGDDVLVPDVYCPREEIKDTDGCWVVDYDPPSAGYWDTTDRIDWKLNHEIGHSTLHLTDLYHLNTPQRYLVLPPALAGMPEQLQRYNIDLRNDLGQELMSNCAHRIGPYDSMRLQQRIIRGKEHHTIGDLVTGENGQVYIADTGGFPSEIPERSYFRLGKQLADSRIEFFGRKGVGNGTYTLELLCETATNENGTTHIDKSQIPIPENGVMTLGESVFLLKVTDPGGQSYYRWMDIRDFNMAAWNGNSQEASFYLKLFSEHTLPSEVDWTIYPKAPEHWRTIDKDREISQEIIDGIPTYGLDKPYADDGLDILVDEFNREQEQLDDETIYITATIENSEYEGFNGASQESIQAFIARHVEVYQNLLRDGNQGLKSVKVVLRRLVIVQDGFTSDRNPYRGKDYSLMQNLQDSDGVWTQSNPVVYNHGSGIYNTTTQTNSALIDYLHSSILAIPETHMYFDARNPNDEWRDTLDSVPVVWREHTSLDRSDQIDLYTENPRMGQYEQLYLQYLIKQKKLHQKSSIIPEFFVPYIVPDVVEMSFKSSSGEAFDHAAVQFFHTAPIDEVDVWSHSKLVKVEDLFMTGEDGKIVFDPDKLFRKRQSNLLQKSRGLIFARILAKDGQEYYRWFDITDFSNAVLLGKDKRASMQLNVGASFEDPKAVDPTIIYN